MKVFFTIIAILLTIIITNILPIDIKLQKAFFYNGQWLIEKSNLPLRLAFYKMPKIFLAILGVGGLVVFCSGFFKKEFLPYQSKALILFLSISLVPVIVAALKGTTNLYCPNQLSLFNGNKPYKRLLNTYPQEFNADRVGKCYPAGHASGGFSLLSLYYILKRRELGLIIGLGLGWIMGFYQILSGSHFISDTIMSMLIAWLTVSIITKCVNKTTS
jgi:membrane-associated PAP2 superfamily phosphatase